MTPPHRPQPTERPGIVRYGWIHAHLDGGKHIAQRLVGWGLRE